MRNGAKNLDNYNWAYNTLFFIVASFIVILSAYKFKTYIFREKIKELNCNISVASTSSEYAKIILDGDGNTTSDYTPPAVSYSTTEIAKKFANANAVVIGDSTAEGLSAYKILNSNNVVWTRGRIARDISLDIDKIDDYFTPKVIFLAYGANDLINWQGDADGFVDAYKDAVALISKRFPKAKICINAVLPVSDDAIKNNPAFGYEKEFNKKLQAYCNSSGITFIDNRNLLKQNGNGKVYESDGIHPRYFYYSLWAENMAKVAEL